MNKGFVYILFISQALLYNSLCYALEVIKLKHRTADEIIPIIKPFLKPSDAISGNGYQLFINTDKKTIQLVHSIIQKSDHQAISLLITLKNSNQVNTNSLNIHNNENEATDLSKTTRSTEKNLPQVRTIEGKRALITSGTSIIRPGRQISRIGKRYVEQEITQLQDIQSGFYVTARLNENEVILEIEPQQQTLQADNTISYKNISTVVRGKLGEWIPLGSIDEKRTKSSSDLKSSKRTQTTQRNTSYIKVEKIN